MLLNIFIIIIYTILYFRFRKRHKQNLINIDDIRATEKAQLTRQ